MPRFFIDSPLHADTTIDLPENVARHIQVLRLNPGDAITLFDGSGPAYAAQLAAAGKKHASAHIGAALPDDGSTPPYRIELIQGIASNEKMDWLIEKAVELAVDRIVPLTTARSVVRLSGERLQRRHAHWQALSEAACEQCGRNRPPVIALPQHYEQWLNGVANDAAGTTLSLLLSPRATLNFSSLPAQAPVGGTRILIGPEGGLREDEEKMAEEAGFQALSLGPRVLRTETAGMALLAAFAARWGGWIS